MEITSNKEEMIFRNEYNGKPIYSIGLSKKKKDGGYEHGYMTAYFKDGVDIPDRSRIKIQEAWMSFYNKDKKTIPTIFINKYELVSEPNPAKTSESSTKTEANFEQVEIMPEDLPF